MTLLSTQLPASTQHRIARIEHGTRTTTRGVVLHVMDGTLAGTLSWWADTSHEADGAHICVGLKEVVQTAGLNTVCWHAPGDNTHMQGVQDGNHEWIGIEHEGHGLDSPREWVRRRKQRIMSANRCAWICYHARLGEPEYNVNVARHSDFPAGGHPCPGDGFPMALYILAARRAYRNLERSGGTRWTRTWRPKALAR